MWRNPNLPPELARPAPERSGRQLATFERPGMGRGPDCELRVDFDAFQGHPFVSLRLWSRGNDGQWYPTRKGLSVRLKEADDLAAALREAVRLANLPAARNARPDGRGQGRPRPPEPTGASTTQPDFDEFGGG